MKIKRLIVCGLLMSAALTAFAQTSNKSESTGGIFGTDVDDFMDVNNYSNVKPATVFSYLGYENGSFTIGASRMFGDIYVGVFSSGDLGLSFDNTSSTQVSSETETVTDETSDPVTTTTTSTTTTTKTKSNYPDYYTSADDFNLSALVGINGIGVKVTAGHTGNSATKYTKTTTTTVTDGVSTVTSTETDTKKSVTDLSVTGGYNLAMGKYYFKNFAGLALAISENSTETTTDGTTTESNETEKTFALLAGTSVDLPSKSGITQNASLGLSLSFENTDPTDNSTYTSADNYTNSITKNTGFVLGLVPGYYVSYDKIDRLDLGFKASCPVTVSASNSRTDYFRHYYYALGTYFTSLTETTRVTKTNSTVVEFAPEATVGLTYELVPGKLTFNAGAGIDLPVLSGTFSSSKVSESASNATENTITDNSSSTVTDSSSKTGSSSWDGTSSACALDLNSGFTFMLADGITLDCVYNVLGDVFSSTLNSQWLGGSSREVWQNVNFLLFHSLSLKLSVKL